MQFANILITLINNQLGVFKMELTNKDKIALLEGLTIQIKSSTLNDYYKFEEVVSKWIKSVLNHYTKLNNHEVFARHYGITQRQASNFILSVPFNKQLEANK
jgi:hypothetical protein